MRMNLGKIGTQESTNLIALTLAVTGIFTVESSRAYAFGNSTFLTVPLSIILVLALFFMCLYAMKATNTNSLIQMLDKAVGKYVSTVFMLVLALAMLFNAFLLLLRFISIIHSYIFVESSYIFVALWVILPVVVITLLGFETLGRMAKIFAVSLGILFLLGFVSAIDGFQTHRLYPLFGDGAYHIASYTLKNTYKFIPAFMAVLVTAKGMNGVKTVKKSVIIGTIVAVVLCFITQMALGLTYEYTSLENMYFPLCRLNMSLQNEDYFVRTDKIGVFIWLVAALIAIAYYVYSASYIFCEKTGTRDIRPCTISFCVIIASFVLMEYTKLYSLVHSVISIIENCSFIILIAIVIAGFVFSLIKARREKGK